MTRDFAPHKLRFTIGGATIELATAGDANGLGFRITAADARTCDGMAHALAARLDSRPETEHLMVSGIGKETTTNAVVATYRVSELTRLSEKGLFRVVQDALSHLKAVSAQGGHGVERAAESISKKAGQEHNPSKWSGRRAEAEQGKVVQKWSAAIAEECRARGTPLTDEQVRIVHDVLGEKLTHRLRNTAWEME